MPKLYKLDLVQSQKIDKKIQQYLEQQIMEEAQFDKNQFVSNIFAENKSDGDIRVILDLSDLNEFVTERHFKMEDINFVRQMIDQNCFMASLDWKDAYFSVKINPQHRKYLRFYWKGVLYQFTCLPNGLKSAPRMFTKIAKVPLAHARKLAVTVSLYIDDSFTKKNGFWSAMENVLKLAQITQNAGFVIHPEKSVLDPVQVKKHLAFIIDSVNMTLKISSERVQKILDLCDQILQMAEQRLPIKVRKLAQLVGAMISTLPANPYGKLDIRRVETFLNIKLAKVNRNYDNFTYIHSKPVVLQDINRWKQTIPVISAPLMRHRPTVFLESDASDHGWGGLQRSEDFTKQKHTNGCWSQEEVQNTTAVSYITKQGGRKSHLNVLARQLWKWAKSKHIWISAVHIAGTDNMDADF